MKKVLGNGWWSRDIPEVDAPATAEEAVVMARTNKSKRKRAPKAVPKLPDLEQSKSAVLNSLTSPSSQRSYDHAIREFIDWYCSESRLAFNKTVVIRYRISLEQRHCAPSTINLRLAAVRRLTEIIVQLPSGLLRPLFRKSSQDTD
jgi:hypothetical protein